MAWRQGEPWRVVESLQVLNAQMREAFPLAVNNTPAAAWGSIGDTSHATSSDHYPHYYDALGAVAVVCARDFPHAPRYGLDAHAVAESLRQSRDPRIGYVISNGRITGPNHGWRWDRYDGDDPHDTHIHVSTVHTKAADDRRTWRITVPLTDDDVQRIWSWPVKWRGASPDKPTVQAATGLYYAQNDAYAGAQAAGVAKTQLDALGDQVDELLAKVNQLTTTPPGSVVIDDAQLERVLRKVLGSLDGE